MTQVDQELLWWGLWAGGVIFWLAVVIEYIMDEILKKKKQFDK